MLQLPVLQEEVPSNTGTQLQVSLVMFRPTSRALVQLQQSPSSVAHMHTNVLPHAPSQFTGTPQNPSWNATGMSLVPPFCIPLLHQHVHQCLLALLPYTFLLSYAIPPQKSETDASFLLFLFILVSSKCAGNPLISSKSTTKHLGGKSSRKPFILFSEMREAILSPTAPQDAFHSSSFLWRGKLNYFHVTKLPQLDQEQKPLLVRSKRQIPPIQSIH